MTKPIVFFALLLTVLFNACMKHNLPEDAAVWNKIKLDFKSIDEDGLTGPASGKVAVHYEFCLPKDEKLWKKVQKIDSSAQKTESRGRVGCTPGQWLVIGSTHQKNWKRVLYDLAAMPEVQRIQQTFFE